MKKTVFLIMVMIILSFIVFGCNNTPSYIDSSLTDITNYLVKTVGGTDVVCFSNFDNNRDFVPVEGYEFLIGDDIYEILRIKDEEVLREARTGKFTYVMFPNDLDITVSTSSIVKGEIVLLYDTYNAKLIAAFEDLSRWFDEQYKSSFPVAKTALPRSASQFFTIRRQKGITHCYVH